MIDKNNLKNIFTNNLELKYGKTLASADDTEKYYALVDSIMFLIRKDWEDSKDLYYKNKCAYYMSLEFLIGKSLGNNLLNLNLMDDFTSFVKEELNMSLEDVEDIENDAALGNGGLGRLAACFMESAATNGLPLFGYGLRYSQGLFKQKFVNGFQYEEGDSWLELEDHWSIRSESDSVFVEFSNQKVRAVPYDYPIIGYNTKNINTLRLWQAEAINDFDFQKFNNFDYDGALRGKNRAEDITRVLYPNDLKEEGSILRFKQQYFFASASLQDMVRRYLNEGRNLSDFYKYHAIQLNDTHPVIAIPELMRIFIDEYNLDFDSSFNQVKEIFAYTNHTILKEALEQWPVEVVKSVCPRTYEYIEMIDLQLVTELNNLNYNDETIRSMRIILDGKVKMAFLGIFASRRVNGVAELHTDILKKVELSDWNNLYPNKFINKTNGITPRRWLQLSNPELTQFIDERIGDIWKRDLTQLSKLRNFTEDNNSIMELLEVKKLKKIQLAKYIRETQGIILDTDSIFDIQIKRFHEYKRQLLNALHIYHLYKKIKNNPNLDIYPRTFIFSGKAAPGYFRAKAIIKYINELANLINNDPDVEDKIKVLFIPNYRVSLAQKLFPASDVSEQISTAGKEASGTGNMKFMLNATPTIGTYDGANVEIFNEAGLENNYLFGAKVEELLEIKNSYNPLNIYNENSDVKEAVDSLINQEMKDDNTFMFLDIYNSLLKNNHERADSYYILKDFESYRTVQEKIGSDYRNRIEWGRKCLINLASSGKFTSDRTINEYADEIWEVEKWKL